MKIGITQIILGSMSLADTLALCRDAGYEAVELVFADDKDLRVDMSDVQLRQVAEQCRAAHVEIGSVIAQPQQRGNLLSADRDERELCVKRLRRSVEIAAALGVDGVLLHPGQLGVEADYQQVWDNFSTALRAVAPLAEDAGVAIGVENVWNKFLLSPLEAKLLVDQVGSDAVGIYLDTANMMAYGYPEQWIRTLGTRIKKVHFKDFVRREHRFVNLLDGDTDWPAIMRELRAIGYDSTLIHEVGGERDVLVELGERMRRIAAM